MPTPLPRCGSRPSTRLRRKCFERQVRGHGELFFVGSGLATRTDAHRLRSVSVEMQAGAIMRRLCVRLQRHAARIHAE